MKRFERWLRRYAEGLVALGVAVVFGALSIAGVLGANSTVVSGAILLTLALLAVTLLRDRRSVAEALRKSAPVRQVGGYEVGQAYAEEAREGTSVWRHRSGTGSHLRTVMLPHFARSGRALKLRLEILDPTDTALCAEFARFRNGLGSGGAPGGQDWTADSVRDEVHATILAACRLRRQSTSLELGIALSRVVSTFRWDLSDNLALQAVDHPAGAGLVFDHKQPYYRACQRELVNSYHHARQVPLERARAVRLGGASSPAEVRELFTLLEVGLPASRTDDDVQAIIRRSRDRHGEQPRRATLRGVAGRLRASADGLVALGVAVLFGLLTVADVLGANTNVVTSAILLTLALLAITLLRDRGAVARALTDAQAVRLVSGPEVAEELAQASRDTGFWTYKGATGGHLRTVTLPDCARHAQQQGSLEVRLEILDPTDAALCEEYARYRNSLDPSAGRSPEQWTADRVRTEAYATVLAACWHAQRVHPLTVGIALSRVVSTFRWDLSASHAIQSREDPAASSLVFDAGQPFYRAFERELAHSFEQARPVPLERARDCRLSTEPTLQEVRRLFTALRLGLSGSVPDGEVRAVIRKAFATGYTPG